MQTWHLLRSAPNAAAFNMALDEALLEAAVRLGHPVLRLYGWTERAASFGYFQRYAEVEQQTQLRPLVRRPTAGGIVAHDADWTYSLILPPGDPWHGLKATESYRRAHAWQQAAFARLGIETALARDSKRSAPGQCFAGYEQSDLLWHGRKIAGAAQRRNRDGLLIQGSIQPPPVPGLRRDDWERQLQSPGEAEFAANWIELIPDTALMQRVDELIHRKYARPAYHRKR